LVAEIANARDITTRPVEVRNEALLDRILTHQEHNGDGRRVLFCRPCRSGAVRKNSAHTVANQIGGQRRKPVDLVLCPAKFDGNVPAFAVARFVQPFPKSRQEGCLALTRTEAEISDHRHCRLLRACSQRPCCCRTTEQRDELAPPCMTRKEHCEG